MECSKAKRSLSAYLDGELSAAAAAQIRSHLAGCPSCREELRFLERLASVAHKAFAEAPFDRNLVNRTFLKIKERGAVSRRSFAFDRLVVVAATILAAAAIVLLASYYLGGTGRGAPAALAVGTGESAFVRRAGSSAWRKLGLDDRLYSGDVVKNASAGYVSLATPRGSKLVLNHNTGVQMDAGSPTVSFELIRGEVFAEVNKEPLCILCDGTLVTVNGTSFSLRKESGSVVVTVHEGVVTYASAREEVRVEQGQQSVAAAGRPPSRPASVDSSKELEWLLGATDVPVKPVIITPPPAVAVPRPTPPAGIDTDLPVDQPLEPPKKKDK